MNESKSNNGLIIWGLVFIFIFLLMGNVFINTIKIENNKVNEYSSIKRSNMHPMDSLKFKL